MFEREMMLLEIRKRKEVLASLLEELEQRSLIDLRDCLVSKRSLSEASQNLKKIGKIKSRLNKKECGL